MSTVKLTLDLEPTVALAVLNLVAEKKIDATVFEQQPAVVPVSTPVQTPIAPPPVYQQSPAASVQQQFTQPPIVQTTQPIPQAPIQNPVQQVPTTATTYTIDQIAVAATSLMDAGRQNELVSLLQKFGVQALTMLPKEQYGTFATELRQLGAKI